MAGEDMRTATDEDDISHAGEFENGITGMVEEFPEGGVEAEDFVDEPGKFAVLIFRHIACEVLGKVMVFEDFMDQPAVKEGPFAIGQLLFPGQLLGESGGDMVGPGEGLAGDGDSGARGCRLNLVRSLNEITINKSLTPFKFFGVMGLR